MGRRLFATAAVSLLLTSVGVSSAQADVPGCVQARVVDTVEPAVPVRDWAENATYDTAGNLWVSRTLAGAIERYDSAGRLTGAFSLPSPGSVRQGPDGTMYAVSGASAVNLVSPRLTGYVVAFDPAAPEPTPRLFAEGLGMPNGIAIGLDGSVYVADSRLGLVRLDSNGGRDDAWTQAAPHPFDVGRGVDGFGMNGIAVDGDSLLVTVAESLSGTVLRVPMADPGRSSVVGRMQWAGTAVPLIPDDLAVVTASEVYVSTTLGRLVRLDPLTGATCSVFSGEPITSVAVVPDTDRLTVGTERGALLTLQL